MNRANLVAHDMQELTRLLDGGIDSRAAARNGPATADYDFRTEVFNPIERPARPIV